MIRFSSPRSSALFAMFLSAASLAPEVNQHTTPSAVLLEDFQSDAPGALPARWFNRDGSAIPAEYDARDRELYEYEVVEEGRDRFLRFDGRQAKHLTLPLVENAQVDLTRTPVLEWRWRVHQLPQGADEAHDVSNDVAASVYVAFKLNKVLFRRVPQTIRYTWSSTQPKGRIIDKFFGNQKVVVLESGPQNAGEWRTVRVNLEEDYRRVFGEAPPPHPLALLILSDANDTGSWAKADYDDFRLIPAGDAPSHRPTHTAADDAPPSKE